MVVYCSSSTEAHKPHTLPGGHVEIGETFQEAFIREAREELGIVVELIGLVTIYQEPGIQSLPAPVRVQTIEYENDRGPQRKYEEFFLAHHVSGTISVHRFSRDCELWLVLARSDS
jgi:ADP-ribose pyrophosphatase YjhB (NUDIX family)